MAPWESDTGSSPSTIADTDSGIRPPSGAVKLADCADDVAVLLDVMGIDRAVIVGYSMGGPIAQLVWHRHRDRVAGLVLCATARNFQGGPASNLWYQGYGALGRVAHIVSGPANQIMDRLVERRVDPGPLQEWVRDELGRGDPAGLLTSMASLGRFDSTPWIGDVDVPTACVITTADRTVSPARQRRLAADIPGATVHLVDGPHDVCTTDPERFLPPFLDACASVALNLGHSGAL